MGRSAIIAVVAQLMCLTAGTQQVPQPVRSGLPAWATDTVGHLDAALAALAGVRLDMSEARVRTLLGRPDSTRRIESEMLDSARMLWYPEAWVLLSRTGVERIACWGRSCRMPNGIRVGSTLRAVVSALGRGHPGYAPGLSSSLYYRPPRCDCWLQVQFGPSLRVRQMALEDDNS